MVKNLLKIVTVFLMIFFVSCGSKKKINNTSDTNNISKEKQKTVINDVTLSGTIVYRTLPVYNNTVIETPCDEFGNLKPINNTTGSGKNKISIYSENGSLVIKTYLDSTKNSLKEYYRHKYETDSLALATHFSNIETSEKIVIRYVWPWWVWAVLIGGILFAALWIYQKFLIPIKF